MLIFNFMYFDGSQFHFSIQRRYSSEPWESLCQDWNLIGSSQLSLEVDTQSWWGLRTNLTGPFRWMQLNWITECWEPFCGKLIRRMSFRKILFQWIPFAKCFSLKAIFRNANSTNVNTMNVHSINFCNIYIYIYIYIEFTNYRRNSI